MTQAVLVQRGDGVEVEVPAEQRGFGTLFSGRDHERSAAQPAAISVGEGVDHHACFAVEVRRLAKRLQLGAVVGRRMLHHRRAGRDARLPMALDVQQPEQSAGTSPPPWPPRAVSAAFCRPISSGVPWTRSTGARRRRTSARPFRSGLRGRREARRPPRKRQGDDGEQPGGVRGRLPWRRGDIGRRAAGAQRSIIAPPATMRWLPHSGQPDSDPL